LVDNDRLVRYESNEHSTATTSNTELDTRNTTGSFNFVADLVPKLVALNARCLY